MKSRKPTLSLFLFIDAFGWEIKQQHPDFLSDITRDSKPLETILGYSSACDPSIISGLTPAEHKLWNSYYYDPDGSPFKWTRPLAALPAPFMDRGRVRGLLSKWIKKRCGFTGYFQLYAVPFKALPLFNYAEQKRIWDPGGLPVGHSIFDHLTKRGIPYYAHDSRLPDQQRLDTLRDHIEHQTIDFAYCSLGRLDALMHEKGTNHPDIDSLMKWYDRELRALIHAAEEQYETVDWYVFTDHGMHTVTGTHDLMQDIQRLGLKWNIDYAAFYDATMARFWFMNDRARSQVSDYLQSHPKGRILSDEELKTRGVFFEDRQYGELIFLMHSGIQQVPSFMGNRPCKGMHGFNPDDPDSKAQIMSNRPIPKSVTNIQHIHHIMMESVKREA